MAHMTTAVESAHLWPAGSPQERTSDMPNYGTGYPETDALRAILLDRPNHAERILTELTEGERNDLAAAGRTLIDLAYVPGWGELDDSDDEPPAVLADDARDRLARHLFVTALDPDLHDAGEVVWDERRGNPRDVRRAYVRADELLAVIAGTKEN